VAQLRREKHAFDAAGARVLIVGMGTQEQTEEFKRRFQVPYPMVCDPQKRLYEAFDLGRVSLLEALKPAIAVKGMVAMAKGHAIGVPIGDVRQLAGVFIIDTGGEIVYSHFSRDPADHPSARELLDLLGKGRQTAVKAEPNSRREGLRSG
jgi:peroxiredoxin